jgi:hypothetical protein
MGTKEIQLELIRNLIKIEGYDGLSMGTRGI